MSSSGRMALAAAGVVALLIAVDVVLSGGTAGVHDVYTVGVRIGAYGLAAFAAATAASAFGWWREPIGRPWVLFCAEYSLLLVNYVIRRTAPQSTAALDVTLVAANVAQIAAYYLVARQLRMAGLASLVSGRRRALLTIVALAAAIAISEPSLAVQWRTLGTPAFRAASMISVVSDVVTFTLVAPLAISTVVLHGGQLFWTFLLLTISVFGWMFNSAGAALAMAAGGGDGAVRSARLAGLLIAALFNAAAATTQWASARRAIRRSVANA